MKRPSFDALIAVVAALLLALATALFTAQKTEERPFSTTDFTPGGYAAYYDLVRRLHHPAEQNAEAPELLAQTAVRTLVIAPPPPLTPAIPRHPPAADLALARWVREGHDLVAIVTRTDSNDIEAYGAPSVQRRPAPAGTVRIVTPYRGAAHPARRVWTTSDVRFIAVRGDRVLLEDGGGPLALERRLGRGRVRWVLGPETFDNAHLALADDARFAVAVVSGLAAPLAFDEHVHGANVARSAWELASPPLRAAAIVVVVALALAFVPRAWRRGPAITAPAAPQPTSQAFIDAVAGLLARAQARSYAATIAWTAARRGQVDAPATDDPQSESAFVSAVAAAWALERERTR